MVILVGSNFQPIKKSHVVTLSPIALCYTQIYYYESNVADGKWSDSYRLNQNCRSFFQWEKHWMRIVAAELLDTPFPDLYRRTSTFCDIYQPSHASTIRFLCLAPFCSSPTVVSARPVRISINCWFSSEETGENQ